MHNVLGFVTLCCKRITVQSECTISSSCLCSASMFQMLVCVMGRSKSIFHIPQGKHPTPHNIDVTNVMIDQHHSAEFHPILFDSITSEMVKCFATCTEGWLAPLTLLHHHGDFAQSSFRRSVINRDTVFPTFYRKFVPVTVGGSERIINLC